MKKQIGENEQENQIESDEESNDSQGSNDSMIANDTDDLQESSDDDDDNDDEQQDEEIPTKKPKLSRKLQESSSAVAASIKTPSKKEKPPTLDEIKNLNETQNLFHSNLFRFQIDEMLKEIKVTKKVYVSIDEWIDKFNVALDTLKSHKTHQSYEDVFKKFDKHGIHYPISKDLFDVYKIKDQTFQFIKPKKSFLIGDGKNQTLTGYELKVDFVIEMPQEMFANKSYETHINGNFYHKRAMYLCFILLELKKQNDLISDLKFTYYNNNPWLPCLQIKPIGNRVESRVHFILNITNELGSFNLVRFGPNFNNVRLKRGEDLDLIDTPPTPYYNSIVLEFLRKQSNEEFIEDTLEKRDNYRDAIKLLNIWLKQRELDDCCFGITEFQLKMFICYLIQNKKVFPTMSSYQVIRSVWNYFSTSDLNKSGITMWKPFQQTPPQLIDFHTNFDVVFLDPSGYYNIFYSLNYDLYNRIKNECKNSINLLNNLKNGLETFNYLFMIKMPYYLQYDHIISIKNIDKINGNNKNDEFNFFNYKIPIVLKILTPILHYGFNNRIKIMTPFLKQSGFAWPIDTPSTMVTNSLNFGLILNPENAFDPMIKGPVAATNHLESQKFIDFWKGHSKLRRFQDGTITETIVLCSTNESLPQKRLILKRIVDIIFEIHLPKIEYSYIANQIDIDDQTETLTLNIIKTFDDISRTIRLMDDLPLPVTSVQGISSIFRYCDPHPTNSQARQIKNYFASSKLYHGKIQLAKSGKWPNDLDALKRLKSAFYIKIAEKLRSDQYSCAKPHCDGIDILKDKNVFRLSITHPKEIALTKQDIQSNTIKKYRDTCESIYMEKESILLPKLTSFLHGLYLSSPAFGPTVCLAKKWLSYHFIDSNLFPDECIELLVAYIFIKSEPFAQPNQPQLGFFRFLSLLATKDWINEFILLNFNNEMSYDDISEIEKKFQSLRDTFPSMSIVTTCDLDKLSFWSRNGPCEQILTRVILLARVGLTVIENNLLDGDKFKTKLLLKDTTEGYDFAIKLKYDLDDRKPAGVDYNEFYLQELRDAYSDQALFFYNRFECDQILVLFRPDFLETKEFKTSQVNCRKYDEDSNRLLPNIKRIIKDFEFIGKGVVDHIVNLKGN